MYSKLLKSVASELTVLYVEDDSMIAESFGRQLGRFFQSVTIANNGKEGLDTYKAGSFDLVITDMDMPVMNGLQLIEEIHKIDDFQAVVVSSGNSDSKLLIELLNNTVFGYITKPIELDVAAKYLYNVCDRIHNKKMLMHYVSQLEAIQNIFKQDSITTVATADTTTQTANDKQDDDFFEFYSAPVNAVQTAQNDIVYADYFSQLQDDDKEELRDLLSDMDASLMAAFTYRGGNDLYIAKLGNSFVRYGNIMMHYQFFSDMGGVILQLGQSVLEHTAHIVANAKDMQMYIGGFCSVMQNFLYEVWENEADNPRFFNDSIINDATSIISLIVPPQASKHDDDLVFF